MPTDKVITKELNSFSALREAYLMIKIKGTEFLAALTDGNNENLYVFSY